MKILNENKKIYKFLYKLNLRLHLTPTQLRYLVLCMYFYFESYFDEKKDVILTIQNIANKSKKPIELIIDDTISKKSKPSSNDLNTIIG